MSQGEDILNTDKHELTDKHDLQLTGSPLGSLQGALWAPRRYSFFKEEISKRFCTNPIFTLLGKFELNFWRNFKWKNVMTLYCRINEQFMFFGTTGALGGPLGALGGPGIGIGIGSLNCL